MKTRKKTYKNNIFLEILRVFLLVLLSPIVLIYLVVMFLKYRKFKRWESEKVKFFELSQLETLSGIEFENALKSLFENMGYAVSLTSTTGDFGADLILEKKGKKTLVQAKRYSGSVGVKAVQEVIAAREHYKIRQSAVVTNSTFSAEAVKLSEESEVALIDGASLERLMRKFGAYIEKMPKKQVAMTDIAHSEICAKYRFWI